MPPAAAATPPPAPVPVQRAPQAQHSDSAPPAKPPPRYASYAQAVTHGTPGTDAPPEPAAKASEAQKETRTKAQKKVSYARTMDDHEVDELVHRLFDHLVPLLKNEIVHDRERIGRRRDARR